MTLMPDKSKLIFQEQNVNVTQPSWSNTGASYDLALYEESGSGGARAVLVVTIGLVFDFRDGSSAALRWTASDKKDFMATAKKDITAHWSEKYQILTTNPTPPARIVGVTFDIQTREGGSGHSHWDVRCKKVTSSSPSFSFTTPGGGSWGTNGDTSWDSQDLTPEITHGAKKAGFAITQRGAIHEFGHLLGYRDEYPNPFPGTKDWLYNPLHLGDADSVMYYGEVIEPRHYVLFADWISLQWIKRDRVNCKGHDWKVSGTVDMTNAKL